MKQEELHSRILGLVGLVIGLMGLWGCSSSSDDEIVKAEPMPVQLMSYVTGYTDVQETNRANGLTRTAWEPPTGYSNQVDITNQNISVYLTQNPAVSMEEEFFFQRGDKWLVSSQMTSGDTYYLYGYIPNDKSISYTIAPNSTYDNGAVMTLNNLPAITTNDICIIVGAKNGISATNANGLTTGQFAYTAGTSNYVFLLFDHIYSCINVRFMVEEEYNKLRTIKLKKLELQAKVLNEATGVKTPLRRKTNGVITLEKTTDGSSPIQSIVFTPDETSGNADEPLFTSAEGYTLSTSFSDFNGCVMSQGISDFTLRSTYDVYDKQGNKVRENCTAENKINIKQLFSPLKTASRGFRYTVKLIVNPTYLYVLSEPDLDSPTVVVE